MEPSLPILAITGPVARVTLNRPRHKNRLQPEDLAALQAMFSGLAADKTVRVVIITGAGDHFSAGFDLNALAAGNVGNALDGPGGFGAMVDAVERLPQATIARLNGGVYGGATDLALACDFRIGISGIAAAMPAAKIGLHYYKSGILRYASRLGLDNAKRMFLTAARLTGEELLRIGFLTELVEPQYFDEAVDALAANLAANAPLAVQGVKLALNELARGGWDEAIFTARAEAALASADLQEGLAASLQKRLADFKNC
ncbi:MAG: 3-hydroxybutyryl-CoA dehydratase [Acidocella sp. 20-57-95]|nr:MAG: 3-hydroxybutyryl-CoA dehydratase [Acidocella sp. 20-57-95]OYV59902.1 MAG: 3-hydroxybutyryl-CoA dehydratase [Acidocella sp. 21-58-7]HQT64574.1 enoyl-CoA hydratase/isomerase family protein [Acidocella sp.]HQU04764.1 enoyl-CoA hydratase/isomerase family protein [Acidocella sp.]